MSKQFNTDGLMVFPPDNGEPITLNAFESIECAIAFDVRDWSEDRRSAWIYAIVFGWDYEDSWDEVAKKFGWDEEDRKRANVMHEQWIKAKETQAGRSVKPMRDPNRIDNFCRMLAYYWHRVPDWRFGQLISNVLGAYQEETHKDIFFPEDHEFLEFFNKYFSMEGSSPYVSGNEKKK